MSKHKKSIQVLLAEDDDDVREQLARNLEEGSDLEVYAVSNVRDCLDKLADTNYDPAAVIVDLHLRAGKDGDALLVDLPRSPQRGYSMSQKIHDEHPGLVIFAITGLMDGVTPQCKEWFRTVGDPATGIGVYHKQREWVLLRHRIFKLTNQQSPVKVFIVHGHDDKTREELRDFAQRQGWEVVVLGEQQSQGQTWIEHFERQMHEVSLAWVLFTPDEWAFPSPARQDLKPERRPRPNVLLECGYFLGAFGRFSNRVLLFTKGDVRLPGDLEGVRPIILRRTFAEEESKIFTHLRPWL